MQKFLECLCRLIREIGENKEIMFHVMNTKKTLKKQLGESVKEGRPKGSGTAEKKVYEWRQQHPEGRKADCHRDTGLDPKTIRKWWDDIYITRERKDLN